MELFFTVLLIILIAAAALWLIDRVSWGSLDFIALILKVAVVVLALYKLVTLL